MFPNKFRGFQVDSDVSNLTIMFPSYIWCFQVPRGFPANNIAKLCFQVNYYRKIVSRKHNLETLVTWWRDSFWNNVSKLISIFPSMSFSIIVFQNWKCFQFIMVNIVIFQCSQFYVFINCETGRQNLWKLWCYWFFSVDNFEIVLDTLWFLWIT